MALTLINTPPEIHFAKNPVEFCFASSTAVLPAGIFTANLQVFAGGTPADGDTVTITFGDGESATFTFRNSPAADSFDLPIDTVFSAAYFSDLQDVFESHYYVNERLSITYSGASGGVVIFEALMPEHTVEISSTGNPSVVYVNTGGPATLRPGYKALAWVCVENEYLTDNYEPTTLYPANFAIDPLTSEGCIDLQKLLINQLFDPATCLPDFPQCGQNSTMLAPQTNKRFKFKFAEKWEGELKPFIEMGPYRALWGGVDYMDWGYNRDGNLLNQYTDGKFLTHKPDFAPVTCVQPEVLAFIIPDETVVTVTAIRLLVSITADDGAVTPLILDELTDHGYNGVRALEKYLIPVGVAALNLTATVANIREYSITVLDQTNDPISETRTYKLVAHQPTTRYFMFLNSLGGIDTIATEGKRQLEISNTVETARRTLLPDYDPIAGQFTDFCSTIVNSYKVSTPFTHRCQAEWFTELILKHPFAVEVRYCPDCCNCPTAADSCVYLPIRITSSKIGWETTQPGLFQIPFEYEQNYQNDDYTPTDCTPEEYPPIPKCLIVLQVSISNCTIDDEVDILINANLSANTSGNLELIVDGGTPIALPPATNTHLLTVPGNGQTIMVEVRDTLNTFCTKTIAVQVPQCGPECCDIIQTPHLWVDEMPFMVAQIGAGATLVYNINGLTLTISPANVNIVDLGDALPYITNVVDFMNLHFGSSSLTFDYPELADAEKHLFYSNNAQCPGTAFDIAVQSTNTGATLRRYTDIVDYETTSCGWFMQDDLLTPAKHLEVCLGVEVNCQAITADFTYVAAGHDITLTDASTLGGNPIVYYQIYVRYTAPGLGDYNCVVVENNNVVTLPPGATQINEIRYGIVSELRCFDIETKLVTIALPA